MCPCCQQTVSIGLRGFTHSNPRTTVRGPVAEEVAVLAPLTRTASSRSWCHVSSAQPLALPDRFAVTAAARAAERRRRGPPQASPGTLARVNKKKIVDHDVDGLHVREAEPLLGPPSRRSGARTPGASAPGRVPPSG